MRTSLISLFILLLFSGCSKYTMAFKPRDFDYSRLQDLEQKNPEKLLLLTDDKTLQILCVESAGCHSLKKFFKTGEITHHIACLYLKQYYENIHYYPREDLEQLNVAFPLMIYPQIVDYSYTVETKLPSFYKTIKINLVMNIQMFNNQKQVIFEKEYRMNDVRSEPYLLNMDQLIYLQKALYKAIFEILNENKKDLEKIIQNPQTQSH